MKDILSKNYSFEEIDTSCSGLETLSQFLCQTFKNYKFTPEYLDWMYNKNPNGGVVGFNAINENELAAHYALIPLQAHYKNQTIRALVSINTATSFKHRGQGLFTILAKKTYLKATNQGFEIILAVANANSIAGFIKKLDFKYIDQLDTCVSPCLPKKIDFKNLKNCFTLPLSPQVFKWRLANPNFNYSQYNNGDTHIVANDLNYFARSIIKISEVDVNCLDEKSLVPKINFWVGISNSYSWDEKPFMKIRIPNFLKPSPLHLIYKNLSNQIALDRTNIHFEAINFDAF
tara:strand:+ start:1404 stop:2270 length:867 start_codon:yes stop_codon:yes gene_type:complete